MGKLFLLPNLLGETSIEAVLPREVTDIIRNIKVFATENVRNTRRFLKKMDKNINIDELTFLELNEHSNSQQIQSYLPWLKTNDVGIISEAGCPGIADPGAELVALAHQNDIRVKPLVGPSSILLALIASGCNGQNFSFNGYLPIQKSERNKALKNYERQSAAENRTQIFIETPYRNLKLFQDILEVLQPHTSLTIACNLTTESEYIQTLPVSEWKKHKPAIEDLPAIFIIYAH